MRPRHIALAGSLLVALVALNPAKASALPTIPAGSAYGIQSDVVQVHSRGLKKQYRRHYRRHQYHRRYYPRYRYRRYYRRYYYPYYYYPYYGYPYYGRPGITLYFGF